MIDRFSVYFGVIASWVSIFAVLDQICSSELKLSIKNYLRGVVSEADLWLQKFLDLFEMIFPTNKFFSSILIFSSIIFLAFSCLGFFLNAINLKGLLITINALFSALLTLKIGYWIFGKRPFSYYGAGFNHLKQLHFGLIALPILSIVFGVSILPMLFFEGDIYYKIFTVVGFLFVVNFTTDYIAILLTKKSINKVINNNRSILLAIVIDFTLKIIIYVFSFIILLAILMYNSEQLNLITILTDYYDYHYNFTMYLVISLYSTMFSLTWFIISFFISKISHFIHKTSIIFKRYDNLLNKDQVITMIGLITLPFFMITVLIFDYLI